MPGQALALVHVQHELLRVVSERANELPHVGLANVRLVEADHTGLAPSGRDATVLEVGSLGRIVVHLAGEVVNFG